MKLAQLSKNGAEYQNYVLHAKKVSTITVIPADLITEASLEKRTRSLHR